MELDQLREEVGEAIANSTDQYLIQKTKQGVSSRTCYQAIVRGMADALIALITSYEMVKRIGAKRVGEGEQCPTPISDNVDSFLSATFEELEDSDTDDSDTDTDTTDSDASDTDDKDDYHSEEEPMMQLYCEREVGDLLSLVGPEMLKHVTKVLECHPSEDNDASYTFLLWLDEEYLYEGQEAADKISAYQEATAEEDDTWSVEVYNLDGLIVIHTWL